MNSKDNDQPTAVVRKRGRPRKINNPPPTVVIKKEKQYFIPESEIADDEVLNEIKTERIKDQKLVTKNNPQKSGIKIITTEPEPLPEEPPLKKRRGRRPNPRLPPDQIEPASLSNTSLQDNVKLKKPRKPREEKHEKRKPYQKHKKKLQNTIYTDPETGKLMINPEEHEQTDEVSEPASLAESSNNADQTSKKDTFQQQMFNNFFNKRLIKNTSAIDESAIIIFRIIDYLKDSKKFIEEPELQLKIQELHDNFKVLYNRFDSLEKNLGSFLIKILRGYMASKICPIPIQTPWALRTEVMANENQTWIDLQRQIDLFFNMMVNSQYQCEERSDEDLLKQSTSSFFLGRGADASKIPPYIYNSEWLITDTGSKGDIETIIVGGGQNDQSFKRTHTICASFRNDLNAGLQLPDIPNIAATIMQEDKKGIGINTQDILPVCDSNTNQ